jgi:RNA polymerase sigma-70 factor (ECF subfamily)
MAVLKSDSEETCRLLELIRVGDRRALDLLLARQQPVLRGFVEVRLSPQIAARVDPSDVVQETLLVVVQRMEDYLRRQPMPFHLWTRKTAQERLIDLYRTHEKRARRSVRREERWPERSSLLVARGLLGKRSSPSQQAMSRELSERIAHAVSRLAPTDREILLMRHGESMDFGEIGCLLEIDPATARKRFGRALIRLQKLLTEEGVLEE